MRSPTLWSFIILCLPLFACEPSDKTRLSRAQNLSSNKKYTEAIAEYTKLINRRKLMQPALYNRGIAYLEFHQYDKALEDFNVLIGLHSRNGYVFVCNEKNPLLRPKEDEISVLKAFFRRGQVLYFMDSLSRAFSDFQFCLDQQFEAQSLCHLWQGHIRLKQGDKRKACLAFQASRQTATNVSAAQEAEELLKVYCQQTIANTRLLQ